MTVLLNLEPRHAERRVVEPAIEFEDSYYAQRDRTKCVTCCLEASNVIETTMSATQ
jgi:hypothetical protein